MSKVYIYKRFLVIFCAAAIALSTTGCSSGGTSDPSAPNSAVPAFGENFIITDSGVSDDYENGGEDYEEEPYDVESESWAIYLYLCGSNLESDSGFASGDLEEIMMVALPDNVTVVIEAGGADVWDIGFDADMQTRCVYDLEGIRVVEEVPGANMGDADTLAEFLTFCNENYPADRRAVVFWNHGGGSVTGVAFDETYNYDSLTLPELSEAFEDADFGGKYELIGFDACLMATIDVAATISEFANWMVASEENEPGYGWDYEGLLSALADDTSINGGELGVYICDTYYEGCESVGQADEATLSVIDLTKIPELVDAYDTAGCEALIAMATSPEEYIGAFGRAAYSAENYGGNNKSEGYTNMVDLGDLVRLLDAESLLEMTGDGVLKALEDCVYYKINGPLRSRASGLSCYYSYNGDYENFVEYAELAASPAFAYFFDYALTGYPNDDMYDYVLQNAPDISGGSIEAQDVVRPDAEALEDHPVIITEDGYAVLELGREMAEQLVGVYFNLAYIDLESGILVFLGMDNDLYADWENGVFTDNFQGTWGSIDGAYVYMEITDRAEGYQTYAVPILLNGEEYTLSVSYIYGTGEYKILGARRGIDENGMSDKNIRPLIPGDIVEPLLYVIADMDNTDEVELLAVEEIVVTENTSFYDLDVGDGTFAYLFEMVDNQNTSYLSEAVFISIEDGVISLS